MVDQYDIFNNIETVPQLLAARVKLSPDAIAAFGLSAEDDWKSISWASLERLINLAEEQLSECGCQSGDVIAIMASSSIFWDVAQYAILASGGVVVGIDVHDTGDNINSILASASVRGIIVDSSINLESIETGQLDRLSFILEIKADSSLNTFQSIVLKSSTEKQPSHSKTKKPALEDPATIIFTSGTTGTPKGITYTHGQIIAACRSVTCAYRDVDNGSNLVCWLPLSNLFQRMMNYCAAAVGAKTYYVSSPKKIIHYLPECSPSVFIAVPRFYEKLYEGIKERVDQSTALSQWLFQRIHKISLWANNNRRSGRLVRLSTAVIAINNTILFNNLKTKIFGRELRYAISGSAPMPVWLLEWFEAIGVLILEAYGISENIIPNACNTAQRFKFGTVGKALSPNLIRLSEDNEIEVCGPGLFTGYLPDTQDQKNLTEDGFLQTGDEGEIDEDGYITLKGRRSDFFKTSTGRRIAPLAVEKALAQCPFLEYPMLIGEGRKMPIACAFWSHPTQKDQSLILLQQSILKELSHYDFSYQKPAAILLITKPYSIAGGELTANLKLKKTSVEQKYSTEINMSYEALNTSDKSSPYQINNHSLLVFL